MGAYIRLHVRLFALTSSTVIFRVREGWTDCPNKYVRQSTTKHDPIKIQNVHWPSDSYWHQKRARGLRVSPESVRHWLRQTPIIAKARAHAD